MPRIDPVPRQALGDLKTILDAAESRMGFVLNSQLILAHRPEIVRPFAQLGAAINGPSSTISPQLRNMVSQMPSRAAGCGYCMAHTTHTAERVGIAAESPSAVRTTAPVRKGADKEQAENGRSAH
jgi:alkylhydroperoxidase family enzyme